MHLPGLWPAYYSKAKGCEVWDLDGNKYTDMSYMGIGSCILGYADKDVNLAVKRAIDGGSMSTLNAPEEVELAETLLRIHPWADMVRYARSGDVHCCSHREGGDQERYNIILRLSWMERLVSIIQSCG